MPELPEPPGAARPGDAGPARPFDVSPAAIGVTLAIVAGTALLGWPPGTPGRWRRPARCS